MSFTANASTSRSRTSSLGYANAEVLESSKLSSFRDSLAKSYRKLEEPEFSVSQILTKQLAREFTTARRYLLATAAVKELSEDFYAAEEQQRYRAMELIEYARVNGIKIDDYTSQVDKTPIDKSLAPAEFIQELLLQEHQDVKYLDRAMAKASETLSSNADLVNFLDSIRSAHMDRQEHVSELLNQITPVLHIPQTLTVLESASAQSGDFASRFNIENFPKAQDFGGLYGNNEQQFSLPHVTAAGAIGVAAVDPESLPSTEDILEALPIDTDGLMETVDTFATFIDEQSFPSTVEILDALPIDTDGFLETVDSLATFIEEQSELVDTFQQNVMEAEIMSQIVDLVANLC